MSDSEQKDITIWMEKPPRIYASMAEKRRHEALLEEKRIRELTEVWRKVNND